MRRRRAPLRWDDADRNGIDELMRMLDYIEQIDGKPLPSDWEDEPEDDDAWDDDMTQSDWDAWNDDEWK